MALREDLDRAAAAAARFVAPGEELTGVVPAEPEPGERSYLCAFQAGEERTWLVLDDEGNPVADRDRIRRVVSIIAICELAEESAGGGELEELRQQLVALRLSESPPGIEEAEEAALALEQAIGAPPRLAEPRIPRPGRRGDAPTGGSARAVGRLPVRGGDEAGDGRRRGAGARRAVGLQAPLDEPTAIVGAMEGGFGFPLGGDPDELMRSLQEFAARQAESVAEAQREQFATLTLNTAVDLTGAALKRMNVEGGPDEQAIALRDAMRVLFPEAVALVSAARQGFMREP